MTQGLSDVCDPNFKPKRGDPHKQQLFMEKNLFMPCCSRPSKLTMAGLLSKNMSMTKMAQQILYQLHQHHTESEYPEQRS